MVHTLLCEDHHVEYISRINKYWTPSMLEIMIVDLADSFPKIKELIVSSLKVYHQTFIQFDFR